MLDGLRFLGTAIRRHWGLALLAVAATAALSAAAAKIFPGTWHVEVRILAQPDPVTASLANPGRMMPSDPRAQLAAAAELLTSRENLLSLVQKTQLLKRWQESRAPLPALKDLVVRRLGGPLREEDEIEVFVELLREKLSVSLEDEVFRIGLEWPDPRSAYALVTAAGQSFVEGQYAQEMAMFSSAIALLEARVDSSAQEKSAALEELKQKVERAGRPRAASQRPMPNRGLLELTRSLEETRRSIAGVRELRLLRLVELESRLAEETASFQPSHPAVLATADAIAALQGEDSPLLGRLQSEEEVLSRELQRRPLRPPVAPRKEKEWEATSIAAARASLERSQSRHERLLERLQAAKIERESARASFSRRFAVVRPGTFPREPVRPEPGMILLGAVLGGLVLALFATVMGELRPEHRAAIAAVTLCLAGASALALGLSGHPAAAVAPPILAATACAMFLLPLRHTALAFLFLMLSLEGPGDAGRLWSSPWAPLGHLLSGNMNLTVPIEALRFTGADVILAGLLLVLAFRRMTFSRIDSAGSLPTPRPLRTAALVSLFAILLLIAWGVARGGSLQQTLWQCHVFALVPVFFFVVSEAIRGPGDFPALGKTVLLAAVVKAVQAIWVRYSLGLDTEALPTATSHHDSMLFAVAFSMLVVLFLEQRTRRSAWWAAALLPILALGMVANNRRLAWVEIALSLFVIFLLSPRTRLKLKLQRIAVGCIPVAVVYLAAGWNSGSRVFAPVAKIRSVVDSNSDRSTRERDVENYNLIVNLIRHPFIPIGFGHEYEQVSMGDDISHIFPQWKYIPHNSALGLFAFSGIPGFTAAWGVITVGVFFAARAFARARDPVWRAAALTSIATVVVYLIQCYGDMGFVSFHSVFLLAPSLAVTGKLSTACGAWRTHRVQS